MTFALEQDPVDDIGQDTGFAELDEAMAGRDFDFALELAGRLLAPLPVEEPDMWAESAPVIFNEQEIRGRCDFTGRNYLRRPIRDNNNHQVREQTLVFGRGCGKTLTQIIGILYKIKHAPPRGQMVFPATKGEGGSQNFVTTRLIPDLEATPAMAELMPAGQKRFEVNGQHVRLNGAHFGFVGSNSAGQVVGNRLSDIRMDEKEKFKFKLGNEAGTADLITGSTEGVAEYQIFNTSTPSIEEGLIWKDLSRSNLHLYFVPCPLCNGGQHAAKEEDRVREMVADGLKGWIIYGWSKDFITALPEVISVPGPVMGTSIPYGFVYWDKSAKARDGEWDMNAVARTTHVACPHCKGHIFDTGRRADMTANKEWMDANGGWLCVKPGELKHVGYHCSSLYAPVMNEESSWGGRAVKFLSACAEGGTKVLNFVNAILALVYANQESQDRTRIEVPGATAAAVGSVTYWTDLSVDNQQLYPSKWLVCRRWIASVLRAARARDAQNKFFNELPGAEQTLVENLLGTTPDCSTAGGKGPALYSPQWIVEEVQRTDHWVRICDWLLANGLIGPRLTEFFQTEFQGDLIRMLEFVCKQPGVQVKLGRQGDSEAVEIGSADSWEEIDEVQKRNGVANVDVIIDARFGSMDNGEVFAECFRRCPAPKGFVYFTPLLNGGKFFGSPFPGSKPFAVAGWTPVMGFPEHKVWANKDKIRLPYGEVVDDPFKGTSEARQSFQYVFQFDAQWALGELARIRKKYEWGLAHNCRFTGFNSAMKAVTLDDYNKHMKGYFWDEREGRWVAPGKKGGSQSRAHPNHLYDCEKNSLARAVWKGIFRPPVGK